MSEEKGQACKHYNGRFVLGDRSKMCGNGINVREITGGDDVGWLLRTPCNTGNQTGIKCSKFEAYTPAEMDEIDRIFTEVYQIYRRIKKTQPLVKRLKAENPNGGHGETECPCCHKRLQWAISDYNGHISAVCETEDCVKFME